MRTLAARVRNGRKLGYGRKRKPKRPASHLLSPSGYLSHRVRTRSGGIPVGTPEPCRFCNRSRLLVLSLILKFLAGPKATEWTRLLVETIRRVGGLICRRTTE